MHVHVTRIRNRYLQATQTPSRYGHMAKVSRPLSMGTWQYARKGGEKSEKDQGFRLCFAFWRQNAKHKTETRERASRGRIGGAAAVALDSHAQAPRFSAGQRWSFSLFFPLPSAYYHVPILSGLLTLAMCPYRPGVWVVAGALERTDVFWFLVRITSQLLAYTRDVLYK